MKSVFIASAVRTAIGKFGGALAPLSAVDLGVLAVKEAVARAGVEPVSVDEVIMGHARGAGNGPTPRGKSVTVLEFRRNFRVHREPGVRVGFKAIILGCQEILLGNSEVIVAGGMESMSNVPYLIEQARWGLRMGNQHLIDGMYRDGFYCPLSELVMGETAENLAVMYKVTRDEQDRIRAAKPAARRGGHASRKDSRTN